MPPSFIGFRDDGYIGFPRDARTREAFLVVLGAWTPGDPPPPGMPADAINLAAHGAVAQLAIISNVFAAAWVEAYGREGAVATFAPSNITIDFGTPSAPTAFASAVTPELVGDVLNYPAATLETTLQITVHKDGGGTLADLTAGRVDVAIYTGRWPATIGRSSP